MGNNPSFLEYSLVIPAFNEEAFLPATLQAVQQAMEGVDSAGEVIVVDNNSSDGTARVAETFGARVVFEPVNQISRARNAGAAEAQGQFLIFVDADSLISPSLLSQALDLLESGESCGGGALVAFDCELTPSMAWVLRGWNRLSVWKRLAAGSFVFCRHDAFEAVGGFSTAVYASEEIWLSRRLKRWGREHDQPFTIIADPPLVTSGRKLQWFSTGQILLSMLLVSIPFAVTSKRFCRFWYHRPEEIEKRAR
jgi:glycosyltransferase involved in cell wall biosynthesis